MSPTESGTVARDSLAAVTDDLDHDQYDRDQYDQSPAESVRELADIPAIEVITKAIVMLMSSSAEKLGLSSADPDESPHRDLDEARRLITALAGLVAASVEYLGPHAAPIRGRVTESAEGFPRGQRSAGRARAGPRREVPALKRRELKLAGNAKACHLFSQGDIHQTGS